MADRTALSVIRQARAGDESAQLALGRLYLDGGNGLSPDPAAAFVWLEKAARRGNASALRLIGERVPAAALPDPESARPLFEHAAASGCAGAMRVLADWALAGATREIPVARAVTLLEAAAHAGDVGAQLRLGWCLERGEGCAPAPDAALHWYEQAAERGSHAAKELLADRYWRLGRRDAGLLLEECARRGSPGNAGRLGLHLLREGRCAEAVPWLEQAAAAGDIEAQVALGRLHAMKGGRAVSGVPHSYKSAIAWFERAAREGSVEAWFELHALYSLRSCSLRDPWAARRCLERAAELGNSEAQYRCGIAYLRGRGVEDEITAAGWLMRAAAAGHAAARHRLQEAWPPTKAPPPGIAQRRASAVSAIARVALALARRLELGVALGLPVDVVLRIDPHAADRGHCLVLPPSRTMPRPVRRLILIDTPEKRSALDIAKRVIDPTDGVETESAARARGRRLVSLLQAGGFGRALFD